MRQNAGVLLGLVGNVVLDGLGHIVHARQGILDQGLITPRQAVVEVRARKQMRFELLLHELREITGDQGRQAFVFADDREVPVQIVIDPGHHGRVLQIDLPHHPLVQLRRHRPALGFQVVVQLRPCLVGLRLLLATGIELNQDLRCRGLESSGIQIPQP